MREDDEGEEGRESKQRNEEKNSHNLYLRLPSLVGALQLISLQGHLAVILMACDVDQHESIGCCCNNDDVSMR